MSDPTVPASVVKAAKRAFVRTTSYGYAVALSAGVSASVVLGLIKGEVDLVATLVQLGVAVISPPIAGLVSFLNIIGKGVPAEYTAAAADQGIGGGQ